MGRIQKQTKQVLVRIDKKLFNESKTKVLNMGVYSTYSDYINSLIESNLITEEQGQELMEDTEELTECVIENNEQTKKLVAKADAIFLKNMNFLYKHTVFCYHTYVIDNKDGELLFHTLLINLNEFLKRKHMTKLMIEKIKELTTLRDFIQEKQYELAFQHCNGADRTRKMLIHLLKTYRVTNNELAIVLKFISRQQNDFEEVLG